MNMTLGELIGWLTELQKVAPDSTSTNVEAVRLKGVTSLDYGKVGGYPYGRDAKRERAMSIWLEGYVDGPSQPPQDSVS